MVPIVTIIMIMLCRLSWSYYADYCAYDDDDDGDGAT